MTTATTRLGNPSGMDLSGAKCATILRLAGVAELVDARDLKADSPPVSDFTKSQC